MISDESFKVYSKEITKTKQMTTKREKEIVAKMLDPTTTAEEKKQLKDEIVKGYLKYVIKEANKLITTSEENIKKIIDRLNSDPTYSPAQALKDWDTNAILCLWIYFIWDFWM